MPLSGRIGSADSYFQELENINGKLKKNGLNPKKKLRLQKRIASLREFIRQSSVPVSLLSQRSINFLSIKKGGNPFLLKKEFTSVVTRD
jgi:hypothetical protein